MSLKLVKLLKNAYPLADSRVICHYYELTKRKGSPKYFDKWDQIWDSKWQALEDMGLTSKIFSENYKKTILDVGAGPGIFAWLCYQMGHSVETTELPVKNDFIEKNIILFFHDCKMVNRVFFDCAHYDFVIDKDTRDLPGEKTYDIISLQRTNFDIGWTCDDYKRIIPAMRNRLNEKGFIYLNCPNEQIHSLGDYLDKQNIQYDDLNGDRDEYWSATRKVLGRYKVYA